MQLNPSQGGFHYVILNDEAGAHDGESCEGVTVGPAPAVLGEDGDVLPPARDS